MTITYKTLRRKEPGSAPVDFDVIEESALARAQATIQNAIDEAHLSRADLARELSRPRSFVTRMMSGSHNLTIKTFARTLAVCGYRLTFHRAPLRWGRGGLPSAPPLETTILPAEKFSAGTFAVAI